MRTRAYPEKKRAGVAPALSASPKLLQEGLAGRKVIAGSTNIMKSFTMRNVFSSGQVIRILK